MNNSAYKISASVYFLTEVATIPSTNYLDIYKSKAKLEKVHHEILSSDLKSTIKIPEIRLGIYLVKYKFFNTYFKLFYSRLSSGSAVLYSNLPLRKKIYTPIIWDRNLADWISLTKYSIETISAG